MKDSKAFNEWQRDLNYLAVAYNISSRVADNKPDDVFSRILGNALSFSEEVEQMLGQTTLKTMEQYLKTTAGSLIEIQNLLKISLNLNLISISEYHDLIETMHEIGEIIKKFMGNFTKNQASTAQEPGISFRQDALWTLN